MVIDGKEYVPRAVDEPTPTLTTTPLQEMSLEEIAERITPILGHDGNLYKAVRPDYDLARAIKENRVLNGGGARGHVGLLSSPPSIQEDYLFNPSSPGNPQSTNYTTDDSYAYPYSAVVYLEAWTGKDHTGRKSTCTGVYVGPHTLITAAHCVVQNGTVFGNDIRFTPAAFGHGGLATIQPYLQYSGCYDWWYPSGWGKSCPGDGNEMQNGCGQYDLAAVDFRRCGNPTIDYAGWMGIFANEQSPGTGTSNIRLDGFPAPYDLAGNPTNSAPGNTYPPCGPQNNPTGAFPFECGMTGNAWLNTNPSYSLESDQISNTQGASGGPWWYQSRGGVCTGPCVIGVFLGDRSYFDFNQCGFGVCYRNMARFIDTNFWNFLTATTEL